MALPLVATLILLAGSQGSNIALAARPSESAAAPAPIGHSSAGRLEITKIPFENVEGIVLIKTTLSGVDMDTTGPCVLDTGAGFLAIDAILAHQLGVLDSLTKSPIQEADRPLRRVSFGGLEFDQVQPVLTIDAAIVQQVSERPVLGLIGARLLRNDVVAIDYRDDSLAVIAVPAEPRDHDRQLAASSSGDSAAERVPAGLGRDTIATSDEKPRIAASREALGGTLGPRAIAVPFRLAGDDKIVIDAALRHADGRTRLRLILDTGATKTALFAHALEERAPEYTRWPALRGLSAPTLLGATDSWLVRVPSLEIGAGELVARSSQVDAGVLDSPLERALSDEVGEPIDGLLGYSFLRRFRIAIDYPHRVLWFEPVPHTEDERPYEYSHVGLQIERRDGALTVVGVASGSPADRAGVRRGDEIAGIDHTPAAELDVIRATRLLEGPPGSSVTLRVQRDGEERVFRLVRRKLL